jgi:hypothetical protein
VAAVAHEHHHAIPRRHVRGDPSVPGEGERLVLGDSVPNPDDDARFRRQDRSTVAMPAPIFGWIPGKETTILSQSYPVYRKALRNGHVAK